MDKKWIALVVVCLLPVAASAQKVPGTYKGTMTKADYAESGFWQTDFFSRTNLKFTVRAAFPGYFVRLPTVTDWYTSVDAANLNYFSGYSYRTFFEQGYECRQDFRVSFSRKTNKKGRRQFILGEWTTCNDPELSSYHVIYTGLLAPVVRR